MVVRMLLKSCAMPPARRPIAFDLLRLAQLLFEAQPLAALTDVSKGTRHRRTEPRQLSLGHVVVRAGLERRDRRVFSSRTRDDDERDFLTGLLERFDGARPAEAPAVHARTARRPTWRRRTPSSGRLIVSTRTLTTS